MAYLPALMFFHGWSDFNQIPTMLLVEIVLLNGLLSIFAAYGFKKYGFLAPVGIHVWTDIVWHVLWGAFSLESIQEKAVRRHCPGDAAAPA
jgi:hypothetical protein